MILNANLIVQHIIKIIIKIVLIFNASVRSIVFAKKKIIIRILAHAFVRIVGI